MQKHLKEEEKEAPKQADTDVEDGEEYYDEEEEPVTKPPEEVKKPLEVRPKKLVPKRSHSAVGKKVLEETKLGRPGKRKGSQGRDDEDEERNEAEDSEEDSHRAKLKDLKM